MRRLPQAMLVTGILVPLVALAACTAPEAPPEDRPTVTRAQVAWMDAVCGEVTSLDQYREPPTTSPGSSPFGEDRDFSASSHVSSVVTAVETSIGTLTALPPLGVAPADKLVADRLRELNRIKPDVDRIGQEESVGSTRTAAQSQDSAKRVSRLVVSLAVPDPSLEALATGDPSLALAYDVAPSCDPIARQNVAAPPAAASPGPAMLPVPSDGTNLAACADGTCQVRVDKPTAVTVAGTVYQIDTDMDPVTVSTQYPDGGSSQVSIGVGGSGGFGSGGRTTTVAVDGASGGVVIMRFVTKP